MTGVGSWWSPPTPWGASQGQFGLPVNASC